MHVWRLIVTLACTAAVVGCPGQSAPREEAAPEGAGADTERAGAPAPGSASAPAGELTVVAKEYAFEVPGPLPAGMTTIRLANAGGETHHLQLYRLEDGKSATDFQTHLKQAKPTDPFPKWAVPAGGPGGVMPGEEVNATLDLEEGSYALVCWVPDATGVPHVMKGMLQAAEVAEPEEGRAAQVASASDEPPADVTIDLLEYDYKLPVQLAPGRRTIRFENVGSEPHEAIMFKLGEGKSLPDFLGWLQGNMAGASPGKWVGGVSAFEPGEHVSFAASFEPGEYVLICFVPAKADGQPHFLHGMVKQISVG